MELKVSPRIQARIANILEEHHEFPDIDALLDRALDHIDDAADDLIVTPHMREQIALGTAQIERGEVVPYDDALRKRSKQEALRRYDEIMNSDLHDQP
jgi:hypothetical protein